MKIDTKAFLETQRKIRKYVNTLHPRSDEYRKSQCLCGLYTRLYETRARKYRKLIEREIMFSRTEKESMLHSVALYLMIENLVQGGHDRRKVERSLNMLFDD